MTVRESVESDLAQLDRRAPGTSESGLAAVALSLADQMDSDRVGGGGKAMVAKELRGVLADLIASAPAAERKDGIDDLSRKRDARRRSASAD